MDLQNACLVCAYSMAGTMLSVRIAMTKITVFNLSFKKIFNIKKL